MVLRLFIHLSCISESININLINSSKVFEIFQEWNSMKMILRNKTIPKMILSTYSLKISLFRRNFTSSLTKRSLVCWEFSMNPYRVAFLSAEVILTLLLSTLAIAARRDFLRPFIAFLLVPIFVQVRLICPEFSVLFSGWDRCTLTVLCHTANALLVVFFRLYSTLLLSVVCSCTEYLFIYSLHNYMYWIFNTSR